MKRSAFVRNLLAGRSSFRMLIRGMKIEMKPIITKVSAMLSMKYLVGNPILSKLYVGESIPVICYPSSQREESNKFAILSSSKLNQW